METHGGAVAAPYYRLLAQGEGWRLSDVVCRSGPGDRSFEERHNWAVVAAVLEGTFTYRSARGRVLMTAGSLLLGNAGACYMCGHEHGRGDRCLAFQFAPELMEDTAAGLRGARRSNFTGIRIPSNDRLLPVFARLRALARAPDSLAAEALAWRLASEALALDQDADPPPLQAREERQVARALCIIQSRHTEALTIAELAREVGMGRRRFASAFRQVAGVTPYQYILNLRLDTAARRLAADRSPVLTVALEAGFGDLSEFTRRFRARFGRPPAQYRRWARYGDLSASLRRERR